MKRIASLLVLAVLLVVAFSCKTTKVKSDEYKPLEKSLLWEISGNGIKQASYLYGTIHMIPGKDYFLPKGTLQAIDKSEAMFFEIDMKDMTDMSSLMGLMNKIFMKDGKTLKSLLNESDYKLVNDFFKDMGLPMFMLEKIKPMFLSAFAMVDMNPESMKSGKIKSYEIEFYEMAQDKNLPTGGLETIDFQIGVFDAIPYEDQAKMLVETIKSTNAEDDEFKKMVDSYKNQDIQSMITMMQEDSDGIAAHEDILLTSRNANWIEKIGSQAKLVPTFFAVGAGHLAGEKGVIHLLRKAGYTVKAVKQG